MIIVGIVVLSLAVLGAAAYVIWKLLSEDRYFSVKEDSGKEQKIYISRKGVNLDSGSLGGGTGELFRGTGKENMDTIVMSQELAPARSGKMGRRTLCLKNLNNGNTFQGNFCHEITLGRAVPYNPDESGILLPFSSVSRVHCRIFAEGKEVYVEDLKSSYGTYVNGTQVMQAAVLKSGDVLGLGKERFEVVF